MAIEKTKSFFDWNSYDAWKKVFGRGWRSLCPSSNITMPMAFYPSGWEDFSETTFFDDDHLLGYFPARPECNGYSRRCSCIALVKDKILNAPACRADGRPQYLEVFGQAFNHDGLLGGGHHGADVPGVDGAKIDDAFLHVLDEAVLECFGMPWNAWLWINLIFGFLSFRVSSSLFFHRCTSASSASSSGMAYSAKLSANNLAGAVTPVLAACSTVKNVGGMTTRFWDRFSLPALIVLGWVSLWSSHSSSPRRVTW